jgi:hypothetical protein
MGNRMVQSVRYNPHHEQEKEIGASYGDIGISVVKDGLIGKRNDCGHSKD